MIVDKIDARFLIDGSAEITLHAPNLNDVKSLMDKYIDGKEYDVKIVRRRARRSTDANAYCWELCGKLAEALGAITAEEIYQECIRKYGVCTVMPMRRDDAERLCAMWDAQGIGNQHAVIGESKLDGYTNVRFFWGSSKYDTKDMSRLIDGIIEDCKELDIETLPPDEIERLKQVWGGD